MADAYPYREQLIASARLVAERLRRSDWTLVYQSRSGRPEDPWLEPDVLDHLAALRGEGAADVVVAPVGFVSDHMEVVYDLDVEARERAAALGLGFVRAGTAGTHPAFVRMIRELLDERVTGGERRALGASGPRPDECARDCCPPGAARPE
jgi:ferrochelatase